MYKLYSTFPLKTSFKIISRKHGRDQETTNMNDTHQSSFVFENPLLYCNSAVHQACRWVVAWLTRPDIKCRYMVDHQITNEQTSILIRMFRDIEIVPISVHLPENKKCP
jgi:hypothetical protein